MLSVLNEVKNTRQREGELTRFSFFCTIGISRQFSDCETWGRALGGHFWGVDVRSWGRLPSRWLGGLAALGSHPIQDPLDLHGGPLASP